MCLAVPGKIKAIEHQYGGLVRMAKVLFGNITKDASLEMVPHAKEGDYVLVHVGVAISVVNEEEAQKTFTYLKETGEFDELLPENYDAPPPGVRANAGVIAGIDATGSIVSSSTPLSPN
jgi:hydrogenase expression/formation protein HypC